MSTEPEAAAKTEDAQRPFDPDALRARYRAERDKRIRADGNEQYVEVKGDFARFVDDPYVAPGFTREAIDEELDVVVIGGGFGGLLMGARLREAGVGDFRIIEKGGDFGGTWYWNRYPGAMCDVESYIYLPLLEQIGYMPVEKYSRAPEILAHSRAIGEKYDLYRGALFQTEVTELRWDEESQRWIVSTNRGDRLRARFVAMANGPLHRPKLPGIEGINSFRGHTFHTSRWDYDYTGGDSNGGLDRLRDKRVGIIGTGATAVQCVPHLGESAKQLYVFQRTPSSIDVRANRDTDPEWAQSLQPGWHAARMDNFNILVTGGFQAEDLVSDGWTDIIRKLLLMMQTGKSTDLSPEGLMRTLEMADFEKMEQIRARVDSIVSDPRTGEALKPYYRQFCKRPCFHDEYLQTFNRPNVTLVDTEGRGVERITERGVVVAGKEYEVDCLIFATGFEVGTDYARRSGYQIYGRDGATLTDKWKDGVATLHGMFSRGFPNCFLLSPIQAGFTVNFPHLLSEQSTHLAYVVKHALDSGRTCVEASAEAEAEWVATIVRMSGIGREFLESCTPGYYNNEGKAAELNGQNGFYGGGSVDYFRILREWREEGGLKGLELG
ncbi:MAG: NAD(P)/FAD-dependent oxidoreductase [Deltaproteobacteria bacterium]|nr:NAD(P)/FAD-dependent oxidoreductase [Deltaproteobacteria bacterium]